MESSRFRVLALVSEEDKPNSDGNLIPMASNLEAMVVMASDLIAMA